MQLENSLYFLAQLVHNFGAVGVTALPVAELYLVDNIRAYRTILWLILISWLAQIISGAGFGLVSYFVVGALPDIHNLALLALFLKITCSILALTIIFARLFEFFKPEKNKFISILLSLLGSLALTCAAILRWFS